MSNFRQRPGPTQEEQAIIESGSQYGAVLYDIHYGGLSLPGGGSMQLPKAETAPPPGTIDSYAGPLILAAILLFFVMK